MRQVFNDVFPDQTSPPRAIASLCLLLVEHCRRENEKHRMKRCGDVGDVDLQNHPRRKPTGNDGDCSGSSDEIPCLLWLILVGYVKVAHDCHFLNPGRILGTDSDAWSHAYSSSSRRDPLSIDHPPRLVSCHHRVIALSPGGAQQTQQMRGIKTT